MEEENIFNDVNRWGGNAILLELYLMLLPSGKWHPEPLEEEDIYYCLGWIYNDLGKKREALKYYEQALAIARQEKARKTESSVLNNLGLVYNGLGQPEEALKYFEQASGIRKEVSDRRGEGVTLNNLGLVYNALGQQEEALKYYQEALGIRKEVGDRRGEGETLHNIGTIYFDEGYYDIALACLLLARDIFEEVLSPHREDEQGWIDHLREEVGEKRFTQLLSQVEPQTQQIVERALHEDIPHV